MTGISGSVTESANGRVNLIGEHTDYNGGWVLPTAIPQKTTVTLQARSDRKVVAKTDFRGGSDQRSYDLGSETQQKTWLDYIQGATLLLQNQGCKISGFDLEIHSDVPTGSGLSSSAALEIALLKALGRAFDLGLSEIHMAQLGQKIENEFVGAKVGIMDQMACALAQFGEALFLDTKKLTFERVTLPLEHMDLLVINSGVEHRHSNGNYNQRRAECEEACLKLKIGELRELTISDLGQLDGLPNKLMRRARHVVTENQRVHDAVHALKRSDLKEVGRLFYASHASMRDDYEISVPEIDLLVELCRKNPATLGARLTGGGFGGSIVAIAEKGKGSQLVESITSQYFDQTSIRATVLVPNGKATT